MTIFQYICIQDVDKAQHERLW